MKHILSSRNFSRISSPVGCLPAAWPGFPLQLQLVASLKCPGTESLLILALCHLPFAAICRSELPGTTESSVFLALCLPLFIGSLSGGPAFDMAATRNESISVTPGFGV